MKIETIKSQNRRDFRATYVCEGCGAKKDAYGYDDEHFHRNVIPKMKCESCGKDSLELGAEVRPLMPKYPEGYQV